jgi:hypothetical protein
MLRVLREHAQRCRGFLKGALLVVFLIAHGVRKQLKSVQPGGIIIGDKQSGAINLD